jgi:hypothetical protein
MNSTRTAITLWLRAFLTALSLIGVPLTAFSQSLPDSIVVGTLLFKASSWVEYDNGRKTAMRGENARLTTTVKITNIGRLAVQTGLKDCPLRMRGYLIPGRNGIPAFNDIGPGNNCRRAASTFSLEPGQSKELLASIQNWIIAGGRSSLGPWYFVAEVHMVDTTIDLRAGQATFDPGLTDITYKIRTAVEGVAPSSLATRITAYNRGRRAVHLEFGDCPINLLAYHTSDRSGKPVWSSNRRGPPGRQSFGSYACTMGLNLREVAALDSVPFVLNVLTYELLADSLPPGRYYINACILYT